MQLQPFALYTLLFLNHAASLLCHVHRQPTGWSSGSDDLPEVLVPIRLDCEYGGIRHRDVLLWNSNEAALTVRTVL